MYIAYHIKREYALFSAQHPIAPLSAYHIKHEYVLAKWSKVKPSFIFTYFIATHVSDTFITISKTVFLATQVPDLTIPLHELYLLL